MDNRLKRDLVKFFKKMNKNNLALLKDDKSLIKDIEQIEDEEELIKEGIKQCDFVLNYFSIEEQTKEKKDESSSQKRDLKEKEEKEKIEK